VKPKRLIFEVRPAVNGWWLRERGDRQKDDTFLGYTKREAVSKARRLVKKCAPSQMLVFTLKGRIEKGRNGEASYLADSRRRPG
jgi:hypothetical protein